MGIFNDLPREIMLEILTRLPTELVLECKSVCKSWRGIVRLPSFSQMHLARLNSADGDSCKVGFIFLIREQEFPEFYYIDYDENCQQTTPFTRKTRMDLNPPMKNCYIVGSCNGLLCFSSWMVDNGGIAYICNPITREYVILPDFERKFYSWIGFGYSSSTNEYKVVRIYESGEDSKDGFIQVYTLGNGNGWRTVGKTNMNTKRVRDRTGELANGALHWLDHTARTILAFCLTDEKFRELPLPLPCLTRAGVPYAFRLTDDKFSELPLPLPRFTRAGIPYVVALVVKALGDFLSVCCFYDAGGIDIWLLKKNKDNYDLSWSKEFSFKSHIPFPFGFTKRGSLLCYRNEIIHSYDSKASAKMDVSLGKSIFQAIPHKNTLVSLKLLGEKDTEIMESGERVSSSEETGHTAKLRNPLNAVQEL